MNKPHKHCKLIKAWADGAEIQVKVSGTWSPIAWYPTWYEDLEYRVKPKTVRYRVALLRYDDGRVTTCNAETEDQEKSICEWHEFIGWLTDWIEVEV